MIHNQIRTWLWEQTLTVRTDAVFLLFLAGALPEIRRRAAHIMNIALKIRIPRHLFRFFYNRSMTAYLQCPTLMKCKRTEAAPAKAPPVADQREFDLRYRRDSTLCLINRMIGLRIWKRIHLVHLLLRQWFRRWILDHILIILIFFYQNLRGDMICVIILDFKASRVI